MDAKEKLALLLAAFDQADTYEKKASLAKAMRELAVTEYERLNNG